MKLLQYSIFLVADPINLKYKQLVVTVTEKFLELDNCHRYHRSIRE